MTPETVKLLEENIGSILFDTGLSNNFLDMSPQAREIKAKIIKWNYLKLKNFCTVKETINKMKRQPTKWEKMLANDISDKRLISKIYKELINSTSENQNLNLKLCRGDSPGGPVVRTPYFHCRGQGFDPSLGN